MVEESFKDNLYPLKNKVALVTGANQGLGFGYSLRLASLGATVIMICRNQSRGETAQNKIISKCHNSTVYLEICDLSSLDSVKSLVSIFKQKYTALDILVNNAGVYLKNRSETADGFETTFGVNYLAHFFLTYSLISLLKLSNSATVINITSNFGQRKGNIDFDNINKIQHYSGMEAYNQSKLAIVISTNNFTNHFVDTHISFYTVCPGVVRSNIIRDFTIPRIFWKILSPFIQSPEKGCETGVKLITKELQPVNGENYFRKGKAISPNPVSLDPKLQEALWDYSIALLNLDN